VRLFVYTIHRNTGTGRYGREYTDLNSVSTGDDRCEDEVDRIRLH
jgi:hypothetical protein